MVIRRKPTSKGTPVNVRAKALNPALPGRSAIASRRFVNTSWVEIVLAGVNYVFGIVNISIIVIFIIVFTKSCEDVENLLGERCRILCGQTVSLQR